ncbi:dienelactone hydrolase family protein [Roseateles cavernae]|uniref:dienelactone hydrolase family protein n=1 Tax=Roseateles cavernae TaxID=3153578 RepID=UPI0032E49793
MSARWRARVSCAVLALSAGLLQAQTRVELPSLDRHEGRALSLNGHWFAAAAGAGPLPTILLLHGCGGPYNGRGQLDARMRSYSALLNAEGWHALVLDSLTPRGETELCTQKLGSRAVTMTNRRRDALGALQWLAARPEVDPARIALLGWSNGGSTVLAATNLSVAEVAAEPLRPRAAVAFYPGCENDLKRGYAPSAPLLMLVGGADDWTPAAPCEALAKASAAPRPQLTVYPGAYHGFDGTAPLRLRLDVPNGTRPGAGVHVGGQAEARAQSRAQLLAFLREALR